MPHHPITDGSDEAYNNSFFVNANNTTAPRCIPAATFVPKPGCRFYVADFSAIEARGIAWITGEHWRQEVFAKGGDIYLPRISALPAGILTVS